MSEDEFYTALERVRESRTAVVICALIVIVGFVVAFMQVAPIAR